MTNVKEIRNELSQFVEYNRGQHLRNVLANYALCCYNRERGLEEYLNYMNIVECKFTRNHCQDSNRPYVWTMFSVPSQHVMGDCIEECLDKAIGEPL